MKRSFLISFPAFLLLAVLVTALVPLPIKQASADTVNIVASADTFVDNTNTTTAATNYNGDANIKIDTDGPQRGYLVFDTSSVSGVITDATLVLQVNNTTANGPKVYEVGSFDTSTMTYNSGQPTQPGGSALADFGSNSPTGSYQISLGAMSNGVHYLELIADSADGVFYDSLEKSGGVDPYLIITYTVNTPTPTPTNTATNTPIPPTNTPTPVPTDTPTNTPVPPTNTPTPVPPTATPTPIPCPAPFTDGFESGNTSAWANVSGLTVQTTEKSSGTYAAEGNTTNGSTVGYKLLDTTCNAMYFRARVKIASQSSTVNLFKFRTGTGGTTGAAIGGIQITSAGKVALRVDVDQGGGSGATVNSTTSFGSGWHDIELYMNISGDESRVWLDGVEITALHDTSHDLGTLPIGRAMVGENGTGKTYDVFWDDVVVSTGQTGASTPTPTPTATFTPTPTLTPTNTPSPTPIPLDDISLPARAVFYYPWFPGAWNQGGLNPYTKYHPAQGWYDGGDSGVIADQIDAMQYGKFDVAIASWWGEGSREDDRMPDLLHSSANGSDFKWAFYYEPAGAGSTQTAIANQFQYLVDTYADEPNAARVNGDLVVFVYNTAGTCSEVNTYLTARGSLPIYLNMKVFGGYASCSNQPDGWHQYGPATRADSQGSYSYSISPGFYHALDTGTPGGDQPYLSRDPSAWATNVANMVGSSANWKLVTTFNEWGEGTSVEDATDYVGYSNGWDSGSGYGFYLDCLHSDGSGCSIPPTPTPTNTPTPAPTNTPTPTPTPGSFVSIIGAGDIAVCGNDWDTKTADVILAQSSSFPVFALGDTAYESGTTTEFTNCYNPTWGQFKSRTHPVVGNHEYNTSGASGYYTYFGSAASPDDAPCTTGCKGYYYWDVPGSNWRVFVINNMIAHDSSSTQYSWLSSALDTANAAGKNTIMMWHYPRYSSGVAHGSNSGMDAMWDLGVNKGVDLVLTGHEHLFEVSKKIGLTDNVTSTGLTELVIGTGGRDGSNYDCGSVITQMNSCTQDIEGVVQIDLYSDHAVYTFLPVTGQSFTDTGSVSTR